MSTSELVLTVIAAVGVSGPIGALILRLYQRRQERIEKTDLARISLNGRTTPTLVELLEDALRDNKRLRADLDSMHDELVRNRDATIALAKDVSPVAEQRTRRSLSDPKGIPVQREVEVHKAKVDTERPYRPVPRPTRRTRDGE